MLIKYSQNENLFVFVFNSTEVRTETLTIFCVMLPLLVDTWPDFGLFSMFRVVRPYMRIHVFWDIFWSPEWSLELFWAIYRHKNRHGYSAIKKLLLRNVTYIRVNCYQYHKLLNSILFYFYSCPYDEQTSKPAFHSWIILKTRLSQITFTIVYHIY